MCCFALGQSFKNEIFVVLYTAFTKIAQHQKRSFAAICYFNSLTLLYLRNGYQRSTAHCGLLPSKTP